MDYAGLLDSTIRMVKISALLLLLPVIFTFRRLQLHPHVEGVFGDVVVGMLSLTSIIAGSAVIFIYTLRLINNKVNSI